jgi:hypothetical protein
MQLMSSNDERTITSSMTAWETPACPMPRVAVCAREKNLCERIAERYLKDSEQAGARPLGCQ